MSKNYFAIERNGECWTDVILADENGNPAFEEFLDMTYSDMRSNDNLGHFVAASMIAASRKSGTEDSETVVTLVGEDGIFIWGIVMNVDDEQNDNIRFVLVDWKKDGKNYRYES